MVADNMIQGTTSICRKAKSKAICSSYCRENEYTCAAFQYIGATKVCCLLSQADLISARSPQSGSQIYQWEFVDFCRYWRNRVSYIGVKEMPQRLSCRCRFVSGWNIEMWRNWQNCYKQTYLLNCGYNALSDYYYFRRWLELIIE